MTAPTAQFDDDWNNFSSFSTSTSTEIWNKKVKENDCKHESISNSEVNDSIEEFQFSESLHYESLEDLVHCFDEKLASCFCVKNIVTENSQSKLPILTIKALNYDQLWKRLTDNYGLVQPLKWETSSIRKLYIPSLCLPFHQKNFDETNSGCSYSTTSNNEVDDDLLEQQLDYHSMIEYNVYTEDGVIHEPNSYNCNHDVQTADQVIEELEEIMQNADEVTAVVNHEVQDETGIIFNEVCSFGINNNINNVEENVRRSRGSVSSLEESARASGLKSLSLSELNIANEDLEQQVQSLSSELLQELNKRDELKYEIEVKHSFISKVMEVQYKRDEILKSTNILSSRKFSSLKKSPTSDTAANQGKYLTTVIPSNKGSVLTTDNLQSLIKILDAMKADSDEVPTLLTSYILQVICPAPNELHVLKL